MKVSNIYECEVCGFKSTDSSEVEKCEVTPVTGPCKGVRLRPGDIVYAPAIAYSWWSEGQWDWFKPMIVGHPSEYFNGKRMLGWPLYVVLKIGCSLPEHGIKPMGDRHHQYAMIFSPQHANTKDGTLLTHTRSPGHLTLTWTGDRVWNEDLDRYLKMVAGRRSHLL